MLGIGGVAGLDQQFDRVKVHRCGGVAVEFSAGKPLNHAQQIQYMILKKGILHESGEAAWGQDLLAVLRAHDQAAPSTSPSWRRSMGRSSRMAHAS